MGRHLFDLFHHRPRRQLYQLVLQHLHLFYKLQRWTAFRQENNSGRGILQALREVLGLFSTWHQTQR